MIQDLIQISTTVSKRFSFDRLGSRIVTLRRFHLRITLRLPRAELNATLTELEALKVEVAKKKYSKKYSSRRRGSGVALLVWGSITNLDMSI